MIIDEAFRTLLLRLQPDAVVEKGKISEEQGTTRIYYQRSSSNVDVMLDGSQSTLAETIFDVEVWTLSDEETQEIADALKNGANNIAALNGFRGPIVGTPFFIHEALVEDHADDYQSRVMDDDTGYMIATFQVEVTHENIGG